MKHQFKDTIDRLPRSPGVYLMKDRRGNILYVGKAKELRSRVRSYFSPSLPQSPKTEMMLSKVNELDVIVTASEGEAFLLESNLIKKNRPRYNILLRDDKHYPYLRLSVQEPYPRLQVVRKIRNDGAKYFGPYVPGSGLRSTLELINKTFPLRKCKNDIHGKSGRPCLNAQIGRCLSPCSGGVSKNEYGRMVREVTLFLQGKNRELIRELRRKMDLASKGLDFEKATLVRDQIQRIEKLTEQQKMISPSMEDKDLFGFAREGDTACVEVLFVRSGKLLGKKDLFMERLDGEDQAEVFRTALMQYYHNEKLIPSRIFTPVGMGAMKLLEDALSGLRGGRVRVAAPKRGVNLKLVGMASENAALALEGYFHQRDRDRMALKDLQRAADLKRFPVRIEAFDISNIQGEFAVASMVVFENGRPRKSHYRHYRIRSVQGANDFAMMEEVLMRRYREEEAPGFPIPDLIVMDGGKGQLNVLVETAREKMVLKQTDLMALAKARPEREGDKGIDRIFLPGRKEAIVLDPEDPVIHLLQRVRDESHRFAVTYYRKLHTQETLSSRLKEIRGVGKKRSLSLLRHFGSLEQVRRASLEDLVHAPSMNREIASRIYKTLHREANPSR